MVEYCLLMTTSVISPFNSTPLSQADKLFIRLQTAIVEGDIPASSKVNELDWSKKYDVSRATLREVLSRLERCHLIERRPNVGARVVALSIEGLNDIYEIRESLEGMACRLAAQRMTEAEIADVQQLLDQQAQQQQIHTGETYYQEQGDLDFHYRIILGCKNERIIRLVCHELYHIVRMYRVQLGMSGPRVSTAFDEHRAIINAIAARDGEFAEILMRRHISASRRNTNQQLTDQEK